MATRCKPPYVRSVCERRRSPSRVCGVCRANGLCCNTKTKKPAPRSLMRVLVRWTFPRPRTCFVFLKKSDVHHSVPGSHHTVSSNVHVPGPKCPPRVRVELAVPDVAARRRSNRRAIAGLVWGPTTFRCRYTCCCYTCCCSICCCEFSLRGAHSCNTRSALAVAATHRRCPVAFVDCRAPRSLCLPFRAESRGVLATTVC